MRRRGWMVALLTVAFLALSAIEASAAMSYSVTLTADPTNPEVGRNTTLTVTANKSLSGTRYSMYVYDQTDPTWMRSCSGQTCSFQVTQLSAGSHTYIAYIARTRSDPGYPPRQSVAVSAPVTVTWVAVVYAITLEADRSWLPPGSTSTLHSTTNRDVGGTAFSNQIFDLTVGGRIAICTSGTDCSVAVSQVSLTTHTYQAFVAPPSSTVPPPNSQASSNVVSVTWSPLPDPSRPPNVGAGLLTGTVSFTQPVPTGTEPCAPTHFEFDGESATAWLNGSGRRYAGSLTINGQGGSGCENATAGSGVVAVSASGESLLGSLSCPTLGGTFARVGTDVIIVVTGDCNINGFDAFRITFQSRGEFVPANPGGGLIDSVRAATFAGAFAVVPA